MSASKPYWPGTSQAAPPGSSAVPTAHPHSQNPPPWVAAAGDHHNPYLQCAPVERPSSCNNSMESVFHKLNLWSKKTESTVNNIWHNLRTGSSVSDTAWGKMNLAAKTMKEGGFESMYKQTFTTFPNETLKKTFACYVSTATGPVPGTLFLSNAHVAFCSDQPISFTAPSGLQTWSYYKVMIPLGKICNMNPTTTTHNPEKYIQIVMVDGHEFWFMGFVNFEKASHHLFESISNNAAPGIPVQPAPAQH